MESKILKTLFFLAFILILFSCEKDEPKNPTNNKSTAVFNSEIDYGTMQDIEGNIYKTVTIGTQTWMAENLRTSTFNDGSSIPIVTKDSVWRELKSAACCSYNNFTNVDSLATFGRIYNWFAINSGKLAPQGWHVPSDTEWTVLAEFLGSYEIAGGKLKEIGISHWNDPNLYANNETGFTALPSGYRSRYYIDFIDIGNLGSWWSTTEDNTDDDLAWGVALFAENGALHRNTGLKEDGRAVRCVMD